MAICRECHKRMSQSCMVSWVRPFLSLANICTGFKIPEVKFLQVSAAASTCPRTHLTCIMLCRGKADPSQFVQARLLAARRYVQALSILYPESSGGVLDRRIFVV